MNVDTIYVYWLVYKMEINDNPVLKMQIQTRLSNHWASHASHYFVFMPDPGIDENKYIKIIS